MIELARESIEKLESTITASADPTGGTVAWSIVAEGSRPGTFVAGTWGSAVAAIGNGRVQATAVSPTVGATGSGAGIELTAGTRYAMFVKVTDASEVAVRHVGLIKLT
jgi:hypothetical protein